MITRAQIQYIRSLHQKKNREECLQFIAEGGKLVSEIARSRFRVRQVFASTEWIEQNITWLPDSLAVESVTPSEMDRITALATPSPVLAIADIPVPVLNPASLAKGLTLVLDEIQDPGNLGTIIRIADWFGIGTVICSTHTVDLFNPKVVQATMGSITRVDVIHTNLIELFEENRLPVDIFGTFMEGEDVYTASLPEDAIVVVGSEASGISRSVERYVGRKLTIPPFGRETGDASRPESLNAAIATAIVCSEFRRRGHAH